MSDAGVPGLAGVSQACRDAVWLGQEGSHQSCRDPACTCMCKNCERKTR